MNEPVNPSPASPEAAPAPVPGTPEHDAALVAKFDSTDKTAVSDKAERPAHIPEKFWDSEKGEVRVEAMAKSYAELEKGRSKDTQEKPETTSQEGADKAAEALHDIGLDYNKYVDRFMADGKLSDADYAEMASKNIPRSVVDAHIDSQVELAQREADDLKADVFGVVGGESQYQEMAQWMVANMTVQERQAYNATMDSLDIGQIKLAVQGVHAKWQETKGSEPELIGGGNGGSQGDVYRSTAQLTADMKDPRYSKDPDFQRQVAEKLARSDIM